VAVALRTKLVHFADTDFLNSLHNYIDNPSVTGFMIEQAVLSSIQTRGLAIGGNIYKSMELVMFDSPISEPINKIQQYFIALGDTIFKV
jgi:hypothetical protein